LRGTTRPDTAEMAARAREAIERTRTIAKRQWGVVAERMDNELDVEGLDCLREWQGDQARREVLMGSVRMKRGSTHWMREGTVREKEERVK
jgi:hypothetical protein